jgi:hypothetical protein
VIGGLRTRQLVTITTVTTAGLAGSVVALAHRGGDAPFLQEQRHPPSLRAMDVARVVQTAPDPRTRKGSAITAACTKRGGGELGNPWSCVVRYRDGKRIRLSVHVHRDGTYAARYQGIGGGGATGCCIDVPGTQ